MILFRADFYRHNPQAVKAFLRAKLQAVTWINQHPDKARSVLARRLGPYPGGGPEGALATLVIKARQ